MTQVSLTGHDAVRQAHADEAAKEGIALCQKCEEETISARQENEHGGIWVGDACYLELTGVP